MVFLKCEALFFLVLAFSTTLTFGLIDDNHNDDDDTTLEKSSRDGKSEKTLLFYIPTGKLMFT
jgi:hypothetical protein